MNFAGAIKELRKGNKITRKNMKVFDSIDFIDPYGNLCTGDDGIERHLKACDFEATDWIVVEEKKPLSEKIQIQSMVNEDDWEDCFKVEDVKQALQEYFHSQKKIIYEQLKYSVDTTKCIDRLNEELRKAQDFYLGKELLE